MTVGMLFFTGVALNRLLIGYGWLGNPLFLLGLTGIAALEVR